MSESINWESFEKLLTGWLESLAPVIAMMTERQLLFVGAIVAGPDHPLKNSDLPIDWETHDRIVELLEPEARLHQLAVYGSGGTTVRPGDLPFRLARLCLEGHPPALNRAHLSGALEDLRSFLQDDLVQVFAECELFNFWAKEGCVVADALAIVPNASAPSLVTLMLHVPQGRYRLQAHSTVSMSFESEFEPGNPKEHSGDLEKISALYQDVGLATQVLRVLQPGTFTPGPTDVNYANSFLDSSGQMRPSRPVYPASFERYDFDESLVELLQTLFSAAKKLQQAGPSHVLQALNRFYLAQYRSNLEDKLVALIIAAEAMFMNDSNAELSYRLATRAAIFLGADHDSRVDAFKKFRTAYGVRSSIVYGSKVDPASVVQSAKDTEDLMRSSIKKALLLVADGKEAAIKSWDDLAFLDV